MKRKRASAASKNDSVSKKTKSKSGEDNNDDVLHYTKSGQLDMRYSSSKKLVMSLSQSKSNGDSLEYQSLHKSLTENLTERPKPVRTRHSLQITKIPFSNQTSTPVQKLKFAEAKSPNQDTSCKPSTSALATSLALSPSSSSLPVSQSLNNQSLNDLSSIHFEPGPERENIPGPSSSTAGNSIHNENTLPIQCSGNNTPVITRPGPLTVPALTIVKVRIPSSVPVTKSNLPDMRTKAGREWIESQVKDNDAHSRRLSGGTIPIIPSWLPRHKDGTIDTSKSAAQHYLNLKSQQTVNIPVYDSNLRFNYYKKKLEDQESNFYHYVKMTRQQPVADVPFFKLANSEILKSYLNKSTFESYTASHTHTYMGSNSNISNRSSTSSSIVSASSHSTFADEDYKIPTYIPKLDYETLDATIGDKSLNKIGNGAFGIVYKGYWNGMEVAIKKLFLDPLTTGDKSSFMIELKILASFGDHPNLVQLYGYTLEPSTLVMEFVKLGSLSHLLYYCEDDFIEAKLSDGRIKKRIVCGIVNGMSQLHSVNIIHGDLKPANILVTEDFTSKITDFGLARLRGKTSSLVASNIREDGENVVAGTAAYMAPELLDSVGPQELTTDVYSFGILVNEIVHEEEPYSQDYDKIRGRGPFGAANLAKLGHRPYLNTSIVPGNLAALIRRCWSSLSWNRPSFDDISKDIGRSDMVFPNFI